MLISGDGSPCLADFGLSRELMKTLSLNPSKIAGSVRWMAKEYMSESNSATMAGDVWAFGMTILVCSYMLLLCTDLINQSAGTRNSQASISLVQK